MRLDLADYEHIWPPKCQIYTGILLLQDKYSIFPGEDLDTSRQKQMIILSYQYKYLFSTGEVKQFRKVLSSTFFIKSLIYRAQLITITHGYIHSTGLCTHNTCNMISYFRNGLSPFGTKPFPGSNWLWVYAVRRRAHTQGQHENNWNNEILCNTYFKHIVIYIYFFSFR